MLKLARIYKIYSDDHNHIYIGSTGKTIKKRLRAHEKDYIQYLQGNYTYITSFDILAKGNYKIELVKFVLCDTIKELRTIEGNTIQRYRQIDMFDVVNKNLPGRTTQQWRIDKKDTIKQYMEQYIMKNKDAVNEYQTQYRIDNRETLRQYHRIKHNCVDCGGNYTNSSKARHMKSKKHNQSINININITINT